MLTHAFFCGFFCVHFKQPERIASFLYILEDEKKNQELDVFDIWEKNVGVEKERGVKITTESCTLELHF